MKRLRPGLLILLLMLSAAAQTPAAQQPPPPDSARPVPPPDSAPVPQTLPPEAPDPFGNDGFRIGGRAALRIGGDYTLRAGDTVREVVVIMGNVVIDGTVDRHVVVIMGTARLGPMARIGDNFVVIGGNATVEDGAVVERDLVVVGGALQAPAGFIAGGEHVVIGPPFLGAWFEGLTQWLTRGLLFGRLIVPSLGWVWGIVAIFFLVYLMLNVVFERPVRSVAATLTEKPLTSFGVGLLVLLLFGPVALLLAVSVIGIVVIPFVVLALLAAWIIGKVGVARWIGASLMPETDADHRGQAVRSFLIGFAVILVAYMIPLLGIITWGVIGVLGLGSATLAFMAAYRRERPAPPAVPYVPAPDAPPPPPVPASYQPPAPAAYQPPAPIAEASAMAPDPAYAPVPPVPPSPAAALGALSSTLLTMPRALPRDRFAAFVLDVIIVAVTAQMFDSLFFGDQDAFPVLLLLYHVGFWTWKQTTIGGIVCQLRLVRVDGQPLSFADALVRALVGVFSLAIFFIGALWMLRDPESQTWHDKVAGTYVVKVPRNWPL